MPKNTRSAIVLIIGVLILVVGYFGVYSQYMKWGDAKAAFEVSKATNEKLEQALNAANAFMSKYESNRNQAQIANRVLPLGDADVPILLGNMNQILTESGMTVSEMNINEPESDAGEEGAEPHVIKTIDINVKVSGSYQAFNNLLLRLQNNMRIMDLVSVGIDASAEEGASVNNLEFTLRLRAYYQE